MIYRCIDNSLDFLGSYEQEAYNHILRHFKVDIFVYVYIHRTKNTYSDKVMKIPKFK